VARSTRERQMINLLKRLLQAHFDAMARYPHPPVWMA